MKKWIGLVGSLAGLALVIGGIIAFFQNAGLLGIGLLIGGGLSVITFFLRESHD